MAVPKSKRPVYADRADAEPTYKQRAFREFIETHTGYEADLKSVQLASSLVSEFRASKEYGDAEVARERERNAAIAAKEARKAERLSARAEKLRAALAAVEAELPAAPARKPRGAAKKSARNTAPPKPDATVTQLPVAAPVPKQSSVVTAPAADDDDF